MKKDNFRRVLSVLCLICLLCGLIPAPAAHADNYGDAAAGWLNYIDANFPYRWSMTESNTRMRNWLVSTITTMGYSPQLLYCEGDSPLGWGWREGYNIEFRKPGASAQEIVVCAHYDGTETNAAEDNGTGVSVLLELAQRFQNMDTPYSIRFLLFDIEEYAYVGSTYYVQHQDVSNVICCINLDSIGIGDSLYGYSGDYEGDTLVRAWPLEQALATASYLGLDLKTLPENYQGDNCRPPAKTTGSDQTPFNAAGIPYLYIATAYWTDAPANGLQQTADPSIPDGKIMHVTEFDNLAFLTSHFGNRIYTHMSQTSQLVTYLLLYMNPQAAAEELFAPQVEERETPAESNASPASNETIADRAETTSTEETASTEAVESESEAHKSESETTDDIGTKEEQNSREADSEATKGTKNVGITSIIAVCIGAGVGVIVYFVRKMFQKK